MFVPYSVPHWGSGPNYNHNAYNLNKSALTLRQTNRWNGYYQGYRNNFGIDGNEDDPLSLIPGSVNGDGIAPTAGVMTFDNPGAPWEDEDIFRSKFLDNLKARYAASRRGTYDSWESASGIIGTNDGLWVYRVVISLSCLVDILDVASLILGAAGVLRMSRMSFLHIATFTTSLSQATGFLVLLHHLDLELGRDLGRTLTLYSLASHPTSYCGRWMMIYAPPHIMPLWGSPKYPSDAE
ncbi:uncharacterized protein DFL_008348 [Arthrobotrys flagrans]|uniref:Uncharacterized protein n=1 Tax=Arthrobotrys flagrans TaxID=97331 RepID=A0A436ZNG8_ARTFL|nr:hypothetical protein DFL_008348 [Arthrobotrys flagrans]